jgi:2',3'-cyclic-nucleotide 2'-phosphodiesterase (5'-nucleotidase family)
MENFYTYLTVILTFTTSTLRSLAPPPCEDFEIIILHNNDMLAQFEKTNKYSPDSEIGGFSRAALV